MSGLGTCRDCNAWIYWADYEDDTGRTRHVPYDEAGHFTMHWQTCAAGEYVTVGSTAYKVERCRKCSARTYWETTRNGKKRQMDAYQDEATLEWIADGACHFDTCVGQRTSTHERPTHDRAHRDRTDEARRSRARAQGHVNADHLRLGTLFAPDLGITWPCSRNELQTAFRKQALKHHPDMGGQAHEFIRVKRAYDALKDLVTA